MLSISNIYGHGFDAIQVSRLESLGFRIRPQVSKFMGAQVCRFIDFEQGPCLELIEIEDDKAYMEFIPDGMRAYCPGISLAISDTEKMNNLERQIQHLRPYALHVNYDGSPGSDKPGWNYLNFGNPIVADTFIWLTACDEPRPIRERVTHHPNTVKGIDGIFFNVGDHSLKELERLVMEKLTSDALTIDGLTVWSRGTLDEFQIENDKDFPLAAIILRAENLDYFAKFPEQIKRFSFMSHPAVHIATNRYSWDLVVIAGQP
jgi:hypothetical protein